MDILRQAQLKLLESLIEFSKVCEENNLQYWLDSGTLLGAVRHQGFIPWDDDIDVCMPRNDFELFLKIAPSQFSNDYFIQTLASDPYYTSWHIPCKVRINKTLIIEKSQIEKKSYNPNSHSGLFIDILPVDKDPDSHLLEFLGKLLKLTYKAKYLNTKNNSNTFRKFINFFGKLIPLKFINSLKSFIANKGTGQSFIYGIELPFKRRYFSPSDIFPLSKITFEGYEFSCPNDTHAYLTKVYGSNYMQPPPLDQRISHHHKIEIY
ncbi:LicD family protein [Acinetobacter indicus]|uniref:LicD family protein n=1 Tax=Acinetobacter indicus TaxID=756892 RepID=UPI000CEBD1F0|nr:LicD family protein [Acinetobacter indicus]